MFGNNDDNDDGTDSENTNDADFTFGGLYERFRRDRMAPDDEPELEPEPDEDDEPKPGVKRWTLGSHQVTPGINADQFSSEIERMSEVNPGLADVLREAQNMVEGQHASRFECGVCGLGHRHSDDKHDIRGDYHVRHDPGFSVDAEFAEQMEFSPYCHCGCNEMAMLIDFYCHLPQPVFRDQQDFEGVLELDNDALISYCRARRDLEAEGYAADVTLEDIVSEAGLSGGDAGVMDELGEEMDIFYRRWRDIKSGANGAPIAGETRQAIANMRQFIEQELEEPADDEPEMENREAVLTPDEQEEDGNPRGTVTFFNATGGYGFIEVEGIEQEVFFHVNHIGYDSLDEGTEVRVEVEYNEKNAPMAAGIELVEDDEDDEEDETGGFNF